MIDKCNHLVNGITFDQAHSDHTKQPLLYKYFNIQLSAYIKPGSDEMVEVDEWERGGGIEGGPMSPM